jgi:hypothetical protein
VEKFLLKGFDKEKRQLKLTLPIAKHFEISAVKNAEKNLQVKRLISKAVNRNRCEFFHVIEVKIPRTLQHILSRHPYPLSQGPFRPVVDCRTEDKPMHEDVTEKTVFSHDDEQKCSQWLPCVTGIASWGQNKETYNVEDIKGNNIQGAASMMDMAIVYTCNQLKCIVPAEYAEIETAH